MSKPRPIKLYTLCHTNIDLPDCIVFLQYIYCLYYMILMSEKMLSQNKLYEIKLVPYQTPFCSQIFCEKHHFSLIANPVYMGTSRDK